MTNIEVIWKNVFSQAGVMVIGVSSDLKLLKKFYSRQKAGCHSNQKEKKELINLVQDY